MGKLEVANCDFKLGVKTNTSLCIYRTGSLHAFLCFKQPASHTGEYLHHARFCKNEAVGDKLFRARRENQGFRRIRIKPKSSHRKDLSTHRRTPKANSFGKECGITPSYLTGHRSIFFFCPLIGWWSLFIYSRVFIQQ